MYKKFLIIFISSHLFSQMSATGIWSFSKIGFKQIPSSSRQVIESKLLANATFQQKFLDDFGALGNDELVAMMELMAKDSGAAIDNWILMLQNSIEEERKLLAYLESSTLTNSLIRYYGENDLKTVLEKLSTNRRQEILEEVGNNISYFNRFKQDSDLLEGWIRYRYEPNFTTVFSNLSANEAELFRFLGKYGDIPDDAFKNLKLPYVENNKVKVTIKDKFERLLKYPDATHDIAYFNKRRAEMLPPDFIDSRRKNMLNIEEVDGAIDLELSYNLDLVPSLKHQAGDFIHIVTGRSYDHMGIPFDFPLKVANSNNPNVFYTNWLGYYDIISKEGKGYLNSIAEHFEKISNPKDGLPSLNTVVINYKHFEELSTSFGKPSNHLKNLTDQFLQQNFASYISTNKLIKLNY